MVLNPVDVKIEGKDKAERFVGVDDLLRDMSAMESLSGSTKDKIFEHWYALKQTLVEVKSLVREKKKEG